MTTRTSRRAQLLTAVFFLPTLAHAHHAEFMLDKPFLQGVSMPLHGVDHVLVTLATGLIAAQIGGRAIWAVPGIFCLSILLGGLLNISGISLPIGELVILASIVICGALLAWGSRASLFATLGVVALFAVFHGEAFMASDSLVHTLPLFMIGCLSSAVLLLGAGVALGLLFSRVPQFSLYRRAGFAMLAAAVIIGVFPSVNDCAIRFIEN